MNTKHQDGFSKLGNKLLCGFVKRERVRLTKRDKIFKKLILEREKVKKLKRAGSLKYVLRFKVCEKDFIKIQRKAIKRNITLSQYCREIIIKK